MYAGNFGEFQSVDMAIEAATLLEHRTDIAFAMVGGGVEESRLRAMVAERNLSNVTFIPQQPFGQMAKILALGDIQFISLKDMPLFRTTLPSKLQATLATGRPIIGAVTGDAAEVIAKSGAGLVVTPGSAPELAAAISTLAGRPQQLLAHAEASRSHYQTQFSEAVSSKKLSELLSDAAARGGQQS